jgi:ferredoxin-NADP reductase
MSEGKKMNHDEMMKFIASIGRSELFEELKALKLNQRSHMERYSSYCYSSYYMKAVRVTLSALGYDCDWVDNEFRTELEDYYDRLVEKELRNGQYL